MTTGLVAAALLLAFSIPATAVAATNAASASQVGTSALITAAGVLVTAIAGAAVAILGALDRWRRSSNREMRLMRRQLEWSHRRIHDLTVALAREGIPMPPEHEPYPDDPDDR